MFQKQLEIVFCCRGE